jgi:proteasome lid subunit RPN8/RPN11
MIIIRKHVRAQIYKTALQPYCGSACGFLLGNTDQERIEYALPLIAGFDVNKYRSIPKALDESLPAAQMVAKKCGEEVMGIFMAFSGYAYSCENEMRGFLIDYLCAKEIYYLCEFCTDGGESIWGISVYQAARFPHETIKYKMAYRKSTAMQDNPRRVLKIWTDIRNGTAHVAG